MASTAILRPRPWYTPPRLLKGLKELRRLPVIPFAAMMLVLIIPAIFANVIAPHEPEKPNLPDRLMPPAWIKAEVLQLSGGVDFNAIQVTVSGDSKPGAIVNLQAKPEEDGQRLRGIANYKTVDGKTILVDQALVYPNGTADSVVLTVRGASEKRPVIFSNGGLFVDDGQGGVREVQNGIAYFEGVEFNPRGSFILGTPTEDALKVSDSQGNEVPGLSGVATISKVGMDGTEEEILTRDGVVKQDRRGGVGKYLLGTDRQGRDQVTRMIYGARISILVALIAIFFAGAVGTTLGLVSGYTGGWVDAVIMRMVDIMLSLPTILLALVLVSAVGPSFWTVVSVIALVYWARYARQVRGETLGLKTRDFVERARVAGASHARIITVHILPNLMNTLVVLATLQLGTVIIFEASLSFLGAGIPRPTPSWGFMVADGRELIVANWWVSLFPGLAILFAVMSLNLLGDWVRDKLDPRLRQV